MLSKMKQYTTPEQTAKLIELGFEKPKGWYVDGVTNNVNLYVNIDENPMMFNYSIGELIEVLGYDLYSIHYIGLAWEVKSERVGTRENELIDALYKMILKLKEEGVI